MHYAVQSTNEIMVTIHVSVWALSISYVFSLLESFLSSFSKMVHCLINKIIKLSIDISTRIGSYNKYFITLAPCNPFITVFIPFKLSFTLLHIVIIAHCNPKVQYNDLWYVMAWICTIYRIVCNIPPMVKEAPNREYYKGSGLWLGMRQYTQYSLIYFVQP